MSLETCAVRARVYKQDGSPDVGILVVATLSRFDIDEGYVGPVAAEATTDEDGVAILNLWPNERGATESVYRVRIEGSERSLTVSAVVPDQLEADLEDISTVPPYPGKTDGEQSAGDAAASAALAAAQVALAAAQVALAAAHATDAGAQVALAAAQVVEAEEQVALAAAAAGAATTQVGLATAAATAAGASATASEASAATALATLPFESATPPASPLPESEWIDTNTGRRYTWFNNEVWVEIYAAQVSNVGVSLLTPTADTAITGYVELRDASGTLRRLAVIT